MRCDISELLTILSTTTLPDSTVDVLNKHLNRLLSGSANKVQYIAPLDTGDLRHGGWYSHDVSNAMRNVLLHHNLELTGVLARRNNGEVNALSTELGHSSVYGKKLRAGQLSTFTEGKYEVIRIDDLLYRKTDIVGELYRKTDIVGERNE